VIRMDLDYRLALIAATFLAPISLAGTWTSPVVLSTGGQGFEAAAAIDGNGNSLALWDERTTVDQIWSRAEPNRGTFGSVTEVSPPLQTTSVFPSVRISTAGFAMAVWSDSNGVWTEDRPSSSWNSPQLLPERYESDFRYEFRGRCSDRVDRGRTSGREQFRDGCCETFGENLERSTGSCRWRLRYRGSRSDQRQWSSHRHVGSVHRSLQKIWLLAE